ncbi:MAG: polyisoprenoid-binding protein [Ignavibacteriae bacterium]|nr:MAG: polyisoprenoid-binding protein [Ignavibacteriota bacterium]
MNTWKIDPIHSEIKFKVKHLLISTVTGKFNKFDAVIETLDDNFDNAKISFEADVNSIDTNEASRDAHLKSADFFDAENYPMMTFASKSIGKVSDDVYDVIGDMTMRGTTKEIKLNVVYNGTAIGLDGGQVAGFEITGKLNRQEFGLKWNMLLEAGGFAVSDEVKLEIFAEMKKVAVEKEAAELV